VYGLKKRPSKKCCPNLFKSCKRKSVILHAKIQHSNQTGKDPQLALSKSPSTSDNLEQKNQEGSSKNIVAGHDEDHERGIVDGSTIYVADEVFEEAFRNIKATLDLVTICREVNVIRYLASVLLREYQKGLIPIASLSKSMQEKKELENKDETRKKLASNSFCKALADFASDLPYEEPIENIQEGVNTLLTKIEAEDQEQLGMEGTNKE